MAHYDRTKKHNYKPKTETKKEKAAPTVLPEKIDVFDLNMVSGITNMIPPVMIRVNEKR